MSRKQKFKPAVAVANRADDPYITSGAGSVQSDKFWRDEILRAEATPGIPLKVEIMHTVVCRTAAGFTSGPVLFQQTGLQCPESLPECPVLFAVTEPHGPVTQLDQEIIQFVRLL